VTRPQTVALGLGLVGIFVVALVAGVGAKEEGSAMLEERAEGGEPEPRRAPAPEASGIGLDDLLGGLVGAVLVALITVVYTEVREARQRVRARVGYARLLDAEIEANERVANELGKHRDIFLMSLPKVQYTPPTIEAWPKISVKLAPLIEANEFASINEYYRQLRVLVDLKENRALAAERGQPVDKFLSGLRGHTKEARRLLSKYANPPRRSWWRRLLSYSPQPGE
jgi:hypothetical protein